MTNTKDNSALHRLTLWLITKGDRVTPAGAALLCNTMKATAKGQIQTTVELPVDLFSRLQKLSKRTGESVEVIIGGVLAKKCGGLKAARA